jgi:cation diffusion facilitator CzcD-associated flavoprotein CzcO
MEHTPFLVVGAGPYGVAAAAYARAIGIDVTVVGRPLDLWKTGMPRGMFLRSGIDWHLDGRNVATFERYARLRGLDDADMRPMPLATFLDYAAWFMGQYGVAPRNAHVAQLSRLPDGTFLATLDDGARLAADRVLLALGFHGFKHTPADVVGKLPRGSYAHTSEAVDVECYRGRRVLIVGGRQSAYEWAALMREHGAEAVHLTHRHPSPRFVQPDWSWVQPMVQRTIDDHGWWRAMPAAEQQRIRDDFWATGRLILEAWLDHRVHQPDVHIHESTTLVSVDARGDGSYDVALDDGARFNVQAVVLATGYRPAIDRIGFLDRPTIVDRLAVADGFPLLDTEFQTSVPNLYVTGLAATRDFGPFFGFTVGCPVGARIVGDAVAAPSAAPAR